MGPCSPGHLPAHGKQCFALLVCTVSAFPIILAFISTHESSTFYLPDFLPDPAAAGVSEGLSGPWLLAGLNHNSESKENKKIYDTVVLYIAVLKGWVCKWDMLDTQLRALLHKPNSEKTCSQSTLNLPNALADCW